MRKSLLLCLVLSACSDSAQPRPPVNGVIQRRDGSPVSGAVVTIAGKAATTDSRGAFAIDSLPAGSHIVRVVVTGEPPHVVPLFVPLEGVEGEATLKVNDPPKTGEAIVWFGGDVMFSRRFWDPNADGIIHDALINPDDPEPDVMKVLDPLAPFISDADISVINLETAATDTGMIHPRKPYTLRSDPRIFGALKTAGVDVIGLGNNHVYDYLEDGLDRMLSLVEEHALTHVGAGMDWDQAVEPAVIEANGVRIALISATSITGRPVDVAGVGDGDAYEPADMPPYYTADPPEETDGAPKAGALRLDRDNVYEALARARVKDPDLIVLVVHGGTQYSEVESPWVQEAAQFAIDEGVDLVVGHHPHVVQGIEVYKGVPIIYSVGNLIFDQQFVETFPALVVEATATKDGFKDVSLRPIWLDDYSPRAMAGPDAMRLLRRVATKSARMGTALEIDATNVRARVLPADAPAATGAETRTIEVTGVTLAGGRTAPIAIPEAFQRPWFLAGAGANVDVARSLLASSTFDDSCADHEPLRPAGWNIVGKEKTIRDGALHLRRTEHSATDSTTRSTGRVKVTPGARMSLVGRWRGDDGAGVGIARVAMYADRETDSEPIYIAELRGDAPGSWAPFTVEMIVPPNARWAQVQLVHETPVSADEAEIAFDDLDLLVWQGTSRAGGVLWSDASYVAIEGGTAASLTLRAVAPAEVTP